MCIGALDSELLYFGTGNQNRVVTYLQLIFVDVKFHLCLY